jgi:hypothetical protein
MKINKNKGQQRVGGLRGFSGIFGGAKYNLLSENETEQSFS